MFVTDYQGILYYEEFVEGDRTTKEALCDFLGHDELTENQVLEYVKTLKMEGLARQDLVEFDKQVS